MRKRTPQISIEKANVAQSRRRRFLKPAIGAILLIALVSVSTLSSTTPEKVKQPNKKIVAANNVFPDNIPLVGNPGYNLACPNPTINVFVVLDRSFSVDPAEEAELKASIAGSLMHLAVRGMSLNATINVFVSSFASYTAQQNQIGSWGGNYNIVQQQGLLDIIGVVNNIYFTRSSATPGWGPTSYSAGIFGPGYGSTNWHDALMGVEGSVRFWNTSPNLVLFVTDGQPTVNNGPDNAPGTPDDDRVTNTTTEPDDWKAPRSIVNSLRSGGPVLFGANGWPTQGARNPVNVEGILVGPDYADPAARLFMSAAFGAENSGWSGGVDFGQSVINAVLRGIDTIVCGTNVVREDVNPSLDFTVNYDPANREVTEGQQGRVSVTVRNTTSNAPMDVVRVTIGGVTYTMPTSGGPLASGATWTTPIHVVDVPFGYPNSTYDQGITVTGQAVVNPVTQVIPAGVSNPVSESGLFSFTVLREPLPS